LVEGQFGFNGIIEWARISKGVREITSEIETVPTRDNITVGLWEFKDGKPLSNASAMDLTQSVVVRELPYDADLVTSLVIEAQAHGDAVRGAAVFTSPRIACLSCHKAGKDGGTVGPDLTAIAKERKLDHLVESVLWPRRDVKPEFVNWQVVTVEGKVLTGYKHSSDGTMVTLRDPASGKLTEIAKSDIEEEIAVGTVMPNGLTAAMKKQQQLDLIRFLSELGKNGRPLSDDLLQAIAHSQMHGPAEFPVTKEPMFASSWPNSTQPVNRDRIYDFYTPINCC
jgi:putative heme-binding domain-containing protein